MNADLLYALLYAALAGALFLAVAVGMIVENRRPDDGEGDRK